MTVVQVAAGRSSERVSPDHAFQKVAAAIRAAASRGKLKSGDTLPSQRQLQEQFGVSKVTILEALRLLEAEGLVRVRPGRNGGALVLDASRHSLGRAIRLLLDMDHVDLREIWEGRRTIEAQAARLAAEWASPAHVARLEARLARLEELRRQAAEAKALRARPTFRAEIERAGERQDGGHQFGGRAGPPPAAQA
jgi:DNA-binding FadR family transcriptional regulator